MKKRIVCVLIAVIMVFAASILTVTAEEYAEFVIGDKGYEDIGATNGDVTIVIDGGKRGLVDSNGDILVETKYDAGMMFSGGYTIFYDVPETDPRELIEYRDTFEGVLCNVSEEVITIPTDDMPEYRHVISSSDYDIASYIFDPNGNLIYSAENTYVASCSEGVAEIRTNPHHPGDFGFFTPILYDVEYRDLIENKTIYSEKSCASSSAYSPEYTAISIGCDDVGITFNLLDAEGNVVVSKNQTQLSEQMGRELYGTIDIYSDYDEGVFCITVSVPQRSGDPYMYDIANDTFVDLGKKQRIFSYGKYYFVDGYYNVLFDGSIIINYADNAFYDMNTGEKLGQSYPGIYPSKGNEKYFLVQNVENKWGYINNRGEEFEFYNDAGVFVNGKALVMDDQNRTYIIDENFSRISEYYTGAESVVNNFIRKDGLHYIVKSMSDKKNDEITVLLDGKKIEFEQPPIISGGRTLVPLRAIFEALGAEVLWNGETQTVTSTRGDITVVLTIGKNILTKNGTEIILDVPPQIVNSRTLVPVRAVSEAYGVKVNWNSDTRTVEMVSSM